MQVASWVDSTNQRKSNLRCTCSKEGSCHASASVRYCNCDATPSVQGWLNDTVRIDYPDQTTNRNRYNYHSYHKYDDDPNKLPIMGFNYGFLRGMANFTIGNLICNGTCTDRRDRYGVYRPNFCT